MQTDVDAQTRDPEKTRLELLAAIGCLEPDSAQWSTYNVTHHRFILRLYRDGRSDDLRIATFHVDYLAGPTNWSSPALQFTVSGHGDSRVEWLVRDESAGFAMRCGVLYWGWNDGRGWGRGWFAADADSNGK